MILVAGALILGGILGIAVYYGHADLLWLPAYILAGSAVTLAVVAVLVVVAALVTLWRRPAGAVYVDVDGELIPPSDDYDPVAEAVRILEAS